MPDPAPGYPDSPPTQPSWAPPTERHPIPPAPPPSRGRPPRRGGGGRTALGVVLLLVAGLSAALAVSAGWTRARIRDEDTWTATSAAIADDPGVQRDVADALARQIVAASGVQDALRGVLPGPLDGLAGTVTERAESVVGEVTLQLVRTDAFAQAWEAAVRASHDELLAALDGNGRVTQVTSQGLVLDLGSTLEQFRSLLDDRGLGFLDAVDLSGIDLQFTLVDAPGIQRLQDALHGLDVAVVVLPIVAVVAAGLGLLVARRRSIALAAGGLGALVGAAGTYVAAQAGRDRAVEELSGGALGVASARVVVDQITSSLDATLLVVALVGGAVLLVGGVAAAATARRV